MQKIIQIYPCLLKLLRKQESVTDGHYYYILYWRMEYIAAWSE